MTIREIRKWRITCDGRYPDNHGPCPCDLTTEAETEQQAVDYALSVGWRFTVKYGTRVWTCNAGGGHA